MSPRIHTDPSADVCVQPKICDRRCEREHILTEWYVLYPFFAVIVVVEQNEKAFSVKCCLNQCVKQIESKQCPIYTKKSTRSRRPFKADSRIVTNSGLHADVRGSPWVDDNIYVMHTRADSC